MDPLALFAMFVLGVGTTLAFFDIKHGIREEADSNKEADE